VRDLIYKEDEDNPGLGIKVYILYTDINVTLAVLQYPFATKKALD
jgi:hypothetical protein